MPLNIEQYLVKGFDENCTYICIDTETNEAVLVDPCGDIQTVLKTIPQNITISAVWLTHTHTDHYDGLGAVLAQCGALPIYVQHSGVSALEQSNYANIVALSEGDSVTVGNISITVLHTPGHSLDSICFYYEGDKTTSPCLLSGDTLFVEGCGRTTPEQAPTLYKSLQRLKKLPVGTHIFPGHDYGSEPHSTLALELEHNRFLRAKGYDAFYVERF